MMIIITQRESVSSSLRQGELQWKRESESESERVGEEDGENGERM